MDSIIIEGGARLAGRLRVDSAKNAVLPLLAACVLTEDEVLLEDAPCIVDVDNMCAILRTLGAVVARERRALRCTHA